MLVSNDKLNVDSPNVDAKDDLVPTQVSNITEGNTEVAKIGLSQPGQNLNYLYQKSLNAAKQNPTPVYIGLEKRTELLTATINDIAQKSGNEYTAEQISRVVEDVKKELNIRELPQGDVNASSGSVFSFLSQADKRSIAEAYQYAIDNNTSKEDVDYAAASLAMTRYVEAKIRSGTTYSYYVPDENKKTGNADAAEQTETAQIRTRKPEYIKSLLEQLKKDELFSSNPFLRSPLFQDVASSLLTHSIPALLKDKITEISD